MYRIELIPKDKLEVILPFIQMLNKHTDELVLKERLAEIQKKDYECVGAYDCDILIGISGIWTLNKLYVGKHIEPDNVIILPEYRSKGVGDTLLQCIFEYAKSKGCIASELNCYLSNDKGIKFWLNKGYRIIGYHMQKQLS